VDVKRHIRLVLSKWAAGATLLLRFLLVVAGSSVAAHATLFPESNRFPVPPEDPPVLRSYRYTWPGTRFSTFVGNARLESDGAGTNAGFRRPVALAVAPDGAAWVADDEVIRGFDVLPARIRAVSSAGVVRTVVEGRPGNELRDGRPGTAHFRNVTALAVGSDGLVYFADEMGLRRMDSEGNMFTIAPATGIRDGDIRFAADGDPVVPANPAGIGSVGAMTVTHEGELWWVEFGQVVRRLIGGRIVTVFANEGQNPFPPYRQADGPGTNGAVFRITGICRGPRPDALNPFGDSPFRGGVWLWDHRKLRHLSPDGTIRTRFGWDVGATNVPTSGLADGALDVALVGPPVDLGSGHLVDLGSQHLVLGLGTRLALIDLGSGQVSTLAGGRPRNIEVIETPFGQEFRELPTDPQDGLWWEARFVQVGNIAVDRSSGGLVGVDAFRLFRSGGQGIPTDPYILDGPRDRVVASGTDVVLSVQAAGTPTLLYRWFRGETNVVGQGSRELSLSAVRLEDAGEYWVEVSNTNGLVRSARATLTVTNAGAPRIVAEPRDVRVVEGDTARLEVVVDPLDGSEFQWFLEDRVLSGRTEPVLMLGSVVPAQAGRYRCRIRRLGAEIHTAWATLVVDPRMVAPTLVVPPEPLTVLVGKPFQLSVGFLGTGPFRIRWYRNFEWLPEHTLADLRVDSATLLDSGEYHVFVGNDAGFFETIPVRVTVTPSIDLPPTILSDPSPISVFVGGRAVFRVRAEGESLRFEWWHGERLLPLATGPQLEIAGVGMESAGDYRCRVSNGSGARDSAWARLTVLPLDQLPPVTPVGGAWPDGGRFRVRIGAPRAGTPPVRPVAFEVSEDLRAWLRLPAVPAGSADEFELGDDAAKPQRFVRVVFE